MPTVAARLHAVRGRIAAAAAKGGREPSAVRLVAVAKTASDADLAAAWAAGHREFGHNRVQALEHAAGVLPEAVWHLIGPLQGNKVRRGLSAAGVIQTVGDQETAQRLERAAAALDRGTRVPVPVFAQVNFSADDPRDGCRLPALAALLETLGGLPRLAAQGLMTLAPAAADESALRRLFAAVREAAADMAERGLLPGIPALSMGMSGDYEIAVEEGATLVRVGRAIFPA
ncbi:MAG TPA: YggS family pyridoxal phosphate-dependent enzyme [Planctomycetota bacterium]